MARGRDWKKVIFSDEKKFNLDGPDGFRYYFHDLRKEEVILSRRQMRGGSVMVWAAIGHQKKTEIVFGTKHMDSLEYQGIISQEIIGKGQSLAGRGWIFQQDNASIHSSRSTKQFFVDNKVRLLAWPAKSPDLNIIENLWGTLSRKVYAEGKQYDNIDRLKGAIIQCWKSISQTQVQNLYDSIPDRIFEVITKNGGCTHY